MFGFGAEPFEDPVLGALTRKGGKWRGTIELGPGVRVPLAIAGGGKRPDEEGVAAARAASATLHAGRPDVERALFEHLEPYVEAIASGELSTRDGGPLPPIASPAAVEPHARVVFVSVEKDGTVEFGYETAWDEEHTLGARFKDGRFVELNGSVLPP